MNRVIGDKRQEYTKQFPYKTLKYNPLSYNHYLAKNNKGEAWSVLVSLD